MRRALGADIAVDGGPPTRQVVGRSMSAPKPAPSVATPPRPSPRDATVRRTADAIRALAMDAVEQAKSGHPGMPMGMADIATVLFGQFLKFDPSAPDWPDR